MKEMIELKSFFRYDLYDVVEVCSIRAMQAVDRMRGETLMTDMEKRYIAGRRMRISGLEKKQDRCFYRLTGEIIDVVHVPEEYIFQKVKRENKLRPHLTEKMLKELIESNEMPRVYEIGSAVEVVDLSTMNARSKYHKDPYEPTIEVKTKIAGGHFHIKEIILYTDVNENGFTLRAYRIESDDDCTFIVPESYLVADEDTSRQDEFVRMEETIMQEATNLLAENGKTDTAAIRHKINDMSLFLRAMLRRSDISADLCAILYVATKYALEKDTKHLDY